MRKTTFTNDEMRDILTRALRQNAAHAASFDLEELKSTAREMGIPEDALLRAVDDWEANRETEKDRLRKRRIERNGVVAHGIVFVIVNTAFLFIDAYQIDGIDLPMHWILPGWGIGLIIHVLQGWFGWEFEDPGKS